MEFEETDLQDLLKGNPMHNKSQNELTALVTEIFLNPEVFIC